LNEASDHRAFAESQLRYAGFVAFTCRVRKDSRDIIQALKEGAHDVVMVTGDAIPTAIHVAREVDIASFEDAVAILREEKGEDSSEDAVNDLPSFTWVNFDTNEVLEPFSLDRLESLSTEYKLAISGHELSFMQSLSSFHNKHLQYISIYGRTRPDEKEAILVGLKDIGRVTMMCGDGGNDVGALKQAEVGIALLSGFGDVNVDKGSDEGENKEGSKKTIRNSSSSAIISKQEDQRIRGMSVKQLKQALQDEYQVDVSSRQDIRDKDDLIRLYRQSMMQQSISEYGETDEEKEGEESEDMKAIKRTRKLKNMSPEERKRFLQLEKQEMMTKKQKEYQDEYERLSKQGESWAFVKAMYNVYQKDAEKIKARNVKRKNENSLESSASKIAAMMDDFDMEDSGGTLPMVKLGDASIASPFTSKIPSIKSSVDIIRQGRCTLVTTIQMYQILALNCLISSYSLSVLHLDGVKYGDTQMTILGILMSISFVTLSRSTPLEKLSPVRPLTSIFHPSLFISLLGQFVLHLVTMMYLVSQAKTFLPETRQVDYHKEFEPDLLNSVVFLTSAIQQVSVVVVNLKGPPFMGGITKNWPLLYSLLATFIFVFLCASETIPMLNKYLKLEPFPNEQFKNSLLLTLVFDILGSFLWDRLMTFIFAFSIFKASFASMTRKDVLTILRAIMIVGGIVYFLTNQPDEVYEELIAEEEAMMEEARQQSEASEFL
jgi:cation-transporting ATPase 13A1